MRDQFFYKMNLIFLIILGISIFYVLTIFYVQNINPSEKTPEDISYSQEVLEASRGDILSCSGTPLATSVPYYRIRMDCVVCNEETFNANIDELSRCLANLFKDKSAATYKNEIIKYRRENKRYQRIGNRLLDYAELAELKTFPIFNLKPTEGGLICEQVYKRVYPYNRLAYRTIGFINTNGVGVGIEGSLNHYLSGKDGMQTVQKTAVRQRIPVLGADVIMPIDGYDIQTTLDIGIQEAAEKALRKQLDKGENVEGATALVMEVSTGAVRAIANMKKVGNKYDESYNYAIGDATEPGSVFKLMTLVSLIEDGLVTLDTPIDGGNGRWQYKGHTFSDTRAGGYGMMDVKTALAKSSNVAFAKLAVENYGNNEQRFVNRLQNMKVGENLNLDIMGGARSTIYAPTDAMWSNTSLPSMAIGYSTLLTPLHTLTFYNAIANNGKMMKPYFIESYQQNGRVVKEFPPQEISGSICSKKTALEAKKALRYVVEAGTAKAINNKEYTIAGKTGTSRISYGGKYGYEKNGYRRYQASFAGFFPVENPKYSVIVVLYSGDTKQNFYGGTQAGPVFKEIADYLYSVGSDWNEPFDGKIKENKRVPSSTIGKASSQNKILKELKVDVTDRIDKTNYSGWITTKKDSTTLIATNFSIEQDAIPNVIGMGVRDAIYILENQGYKVQFSGYGKVLSQTNIKEGETNKDIIKLILSNNNHETSN